MSDRVISHTVTYNVQKIAWMTGRVTYSETSSNDLPYSCIVTCIF